MMTETVRTRAAAHPFLAPLSEVHRAMLARHAAPADFPPGRRIFDEGGPADRFWLIDTGSVTLDMRVPGRGDVVVETLPAGTVLGWSWLYRPYRWSFGARASADGVDAIGFDAAAIRGQFDFHPDFGYAVLNCFVPVIIERLQATRVRMLDLYAAPVKPREGS
jgi:CRP-like cAMP-binding protein